MRVFGLLLLVLAGPALAIEAEPAPALARLAYAKSPAFLNTFAPPASATDRPVGTRGIATEPARARADLRVLTVAAAEHLAGYAASLPPVHIAAREAPAEAVPAQTEPGPSGWQATLSTHVIVDPALAPAVVPAAKAAATSERLAALPGPMHVLPEPESEASPPQGAEPEPSDARIAAPPRTHRKHSRAHKQAAKRRDRAKSVAKKSNAQTSTIPRWAKQMFDPIWQRHAFAYE